MIHKTPLKASTVILLKKKGTQEYKTLLIKRKKNTNFLPGFYVFPGGSIKKIDYSLIDFPHIDEYNYQKMSAYFNAPKHFLAPFIMGAIRATHEKTGLSIVENISASHLKEFIEQESIHQIHDFSNIYPLSRWVTPPSETQRFDTIFFMAIIKDQDITSDSMDQNQIWVTPRDALALYDQNELLIAPPTRAMLERIAHAKTPKNVIGYVDSPIPTIHPYFFHEKGKKLLILPGDKEHPEKNKPRFILKTRYIFP